MDVSTARHSCQNATNIWRRAGYLLSPCHVRSASVLDHLPARFHMALPLPLGDTVRDGRGVRALRPATYRPLRHAMDVGRFCHHGFSGVDLLLPALGQRTCCGQKAARYLNPCKRHFSFQRWLESISGFQTWRPADTTRFASHAWAAALSCGRELYLTGRRMLQTVRRRNDLTTCCGIRASRSTKSKLRHRWLLKIKIPKSIQNKRPHVRFLFRILFLHLAM